MKLPLIGEIATTKIVNIGVDESVQRVMEAMCNANAILDDEYRKVVLAYDDGFHLFSVYDMLNVRDKLDDPSKPIRAILPHPPQQKACVCK